MAYNKTTWENLPSTATPITAANLNNIENEVKVLDNNRLKVLWTNPDTTGTFATQQITLSSDDYDFLVFFYNVYSTTYNNSQKSVLVLKGKNAYMDLAMDYGIAGTYYLAVGYRTATYVSDTTYRVGECYIRYNSGTTYTTDNGYILPAAIYGGKF